MESLKEVHSTPMGPEDELDGDGNVEFLCEIFLGGSDKKDEEQFMTKYQIQQIYKEHGMEETFEILEKWNQEIEDSQVSHYEQ